MQITDREGKARTGYLCAACRRVIYWTPLHGWCHDAPGAWLVCPVGKSELTTPLHDVAGLPVVATRESMAKFRGGEPNGQHDGNGEGNPRTHPDVAF
jgi:hypothetical protein